MKAKEFINELRGDLVNVEDKFELMGALEDAAVNETVKFTEDYDWENDKIHYRFEDGSLIIISVDGDINYC